MNKKLDKIAQRRSQFKTWLNPKDYAGRAKKNITQTFSPQYKAQYERLEQVDDDLREVEGPEGLLMKELLKEMKTEFKGLRYLAVLDRAARINDLAKRIVNVDGLMDLRKSRDEAISEFYFSGTEDSKGDPVSTKHINNLINAAEERDLIIKEALFGDVGRRITDTFLNTFVDPKKKREVKRLMNNIYSRAETLAKRVENAYKDLDTARIRGDIDSYLKTIDKLKKEQESFDGILSNTAKQVVPYLPKEEKAEPSDSTTETVKDEKPSDEKPEEKVEEEVAAPIETEKAPEQTHRPEDPNMMPPEGFEIDPVEPGSESQPLTPPSEIEVTDD